MFDRNRGIHTVIWQDSGKYPKHKPNPDYPTGIDLDMVEDEQKAQCLVQLAYPAKRIGLYKITCKTCGLTAAVTTAGRPDDPRSVRLPCKAVENAN